MFLILYKNELQMDHRLQHKTRNSETARGKLRSTHQVILQNYIVIDKEFLNKVMVAQELSQELTSETL